MNTFQSIKDLNFPHGSYVVAGSGPPWARGLKESHDVDIIITQDLFDKCMKEGWERKPWTYPGTEGKIYLQKDNIELYLSVNAGNFNPSTEELLARADTIEGIQFISLEDMVNFKAAYGSAKHLKDIHIAQEHLKSEAHSITA